VRWVTDRGQVNSGNFVCGMEWEPCLPGFEQSYDDVSSLCIAVVTAQHCTVVFSEHSPVSLAYPVWEYYVHGRQHRCQEDPVSLPSGRLEKTTRSCPHHAAQHRPTGSESTAPYAPRSSRFGSELPSVEDDVDVWCYTTLELHARNDDNDSPDLDSRLSASRPRPDPDP